MKPKVEIRNFEASDIEAIDKIFQRQNELGVPGLKNVIINGTITSDGEIIGYGVLKLFGEVTLILDRNRSKKERAQALRETLPIAILKAKDSGLESLYAVASDANFAEVLRKSFGFRSVPGTLLVLDLTSEDF